VGPNDAAVTRGDRWPEKPGREPFWRGELAIREVTALFSLTPPTAHRALETSALGPSAVPSKVKDTP